MTAEELAVFSRVTAVAEQLYNEKQRALGFGLGPQKTAVREARELLEQLQKKVDTPA